MRATAIKLAARRQVQVSTVLTDYRRTSMKRVLDEASRLAAGHGAKVKTAEIVGLVPRQALLAFALEGLNLEDFHPEVQILENRLEAVGAAGGVPDWRQSGAALAEALSNTDATPGGGSAAAISGAMGCGLAEMALGITLKSKKLDETNRPKLAAAHKALGEKRAAFDVLAGEDAAAFDHFMATLSLPKDDPSRAGKMQEALKSAAEVPLKTAQTAAEALAVAKKAAPLAGDSVISDVNCALHLLKAAALCAAENVRINLGSIKDAGVVKDMEKRLKKALDACG